MSHVVRSLVDAEVQLLVSAVARTRHPDRDLGIIAIALDAGLTRSEIVRLRPIDLDGAGVLHGPGLRPRAIRLGQVCLDALEPFRESTGLGALLPVTSRVVHEQLLRIGEIAGLGEWVTCRHTRRTWLSAVAAAGHDIPILLRLAGHAPGRVEPASIDRALEVQFAPDWRSPLDGLLATPSPRESEGLRRAA